MLGEEPSATVRRAHEDTMALLADLGHIVEPIAAPIYNGPALAEAFFLVAGAAIAGVVNMVDQMRNDPVQAEEMEPFTWELVETYLAGGADALERSRREFAAATQAYRACVQGYDVVLADIATEPWRLGHLSPASAKN
jgi:amidase